MLDGLTNLNIRAAPGFLEVPMRSAGLGMILALCVFSMVGCALAQSPGVRVVDDFGREVVIPSEPFRIVSTAPSITETLFALGLGERVVGVTSHCNYPPEVLEMVSRGELEVVGEFANPSLEKIVGLNPDLVIAHNLLTPEFVEKLEEAGIPVVVVKTSETIEGVYEDIMLIGKACWAEDKASELVKNLSDAIRFWEEALGEVEEVTAAGIAWVNPFWVAGNGTYIHDIITHARGRNVFADKSWWSSISEEELIERNPEYILIPYKHGQELIYQALMELKHQELIHGKIHPIDPDILSRPGPRTAILFEEVVKALHPEVWEKVLAIEKLISPERALVGDLITVFIEVKNPGNVGGEKVVELEVNSEVFRKSIDLNPGESKLVDFTFLVEKVGVYTLKAGKVSAVLNVSPSAEEVLGKVGENFERQVRELVEEVRSLINDVKLIESSLSSKIEENNSKVSESLRELSERIEYLSAMLTALTIATIITACLALINIIRVGKVRPHEGNRQTA